MAHEKTKYSEKLKDPRWQKKRLEIFERDHWKCVYCGEDTKMLCVHHMRYTPGIEPWEHENTSLITLCEDCHSEEHDERKLCEDGLLHTLRHWQCDTGDLIEMGGVFDAALTGGRFKQLIVIMTAIRECKELYDGIIDYITQPGTPIRKSLKRRAGMALPSPASGPRTEV